MDQLFDGVQWFYRELLCIGPFFDGAMALNPFGGFFKTRFALCDGANIAGEAELAKNHHIIRQRIFFKHEMSAAATARSAAGSVSLRPPTTLKYTSFWLKMKARAGF